MHTASHVGPQTPQTSRPAQHATGATTLAKAGRGASARKVAQAALTNTIVRNVYQNQLTVCGRRERDIVIRGFIDEGNDNTESITNGVGFRNDISYGSIAPPVTYVLFAAFIILMKAATVYAMRGLKQAK